MDTGRKPEGGAEPGIGILEFDEKCRPALFRSLDCGGVGPRRGFLQGSAFIYGSKSGQAEITGVGIMRRPLQHLVRLRFTKDGQGAVFRLFPGFRDRVVDRVALFIDGRPFVGAAAAPAE